LAKRQRDGTLTNLKTSDLLQGILSTNMRAGTGLFIADELMGAIAGIKSGEKFEQKAQEFVGQFGRGFFLPLQQITDVIAEFDESLRVQRDTRTEPLFGPIKSTIPGLAQTLPERESPTRAATPEIVSPLFKQLTGLRAIQEKNPAEKELDRLGFESREILSSTGNREADRLMAKNLGPLIETSLVRYIKSEPYQRLSDVQKGALLRRYMIKLRAVAKRRSIGENPALFRQLAKERAPLRERLARE
jgi:hypothetical protein